MKTQWEGGIRLLTIPKGQQTLFSRSEPCWAVTGSDRQRRLCADVARGPSGPARPQARRGGSGAPSRRRWGGGRSLLQGDITATHCGRLGHGLRDLCAQEPETSFSFSFISGRCMGIKLFVYCKYIDQNPKRSLIVWIP